jgi:hypothetical protein
MPRPPSVIWKLVYPNVMEEFARWDSFYLIIGGAAGALIGLQFVVMTLIAERAPTATPEAAQAFSTPTVLHFTVVLFLSAMVRAPWDSVTPPSLIGGIVGVAGVVYIGRITQLMRSQDVYEPVAEDWVFHVALPIAAYFTLIVLGVISLRSESNVHVALYGGAAAALTLLFTGIHNAWDTVTWHVFSKPSKDEPQLENEKAETVLTR